MRTFRSETVVPYPVDIVRAWHERPGALRRLSPPWQRVRVTREEGTREGDVTELSLVAGGMRRRWVARHAVLEGGCGFADEMVEGPFRTWRHEHRFLPEGANATRVVDEIAYDLGLPAGLAPGYVRASLERGFAYRRAQLAHDLARHAQFPGARLRVAITGASGLLGTRLAAFLSTGGHDVVRVARRDTGALAGADAVVHLAGETLDQRWTPRAKEEILRSRVEGTKRVAKALAAAPRRPRVLVVASAIGLYGDRGDEVLTEESAPGTGFLPEVVQAWEAAAQPARDAGIRVVHARLGIVLAAEGGALAKLAPLARMGAGGPVGGGAQWWSWVHADDAIGALHRLLLGERPSGPVNVVSPNPVRQKEFAKTLGSVLRRPAVAPAPAAAMRAALGEMSAVVLESQRVETAVLRREGFRWLHPELEEALRFELGR